MRKLFLKIMSAIHVFDADVNIPSTAANINNSSSKQHAPSNPKQNKNSPETWGSIEFNPPNKCMEHRRARIFQNWPEFYVCSESDFFL